MIKKIRDLVRILEESRLHELSIEVKGLKLSLKKEGKKEGTRPSPPVLEEKAPFKEESPEEKRIVRSEYVGFIYIAAKVRDGASVKKGAVLARILVLGKPRKIKAPYQGRVKYRQELRDRIEIAEKELRDRIEIEGKEISQRKRRKAIRCPVDYGFKLFEIEPIKPLEELPEIQPAERERRIQRVRQEIEALIEKGKGMLKRGNA